ncbi:hypothetical protein BV20DRAFT_636637 [Pilatotrama ljubarskyi]|nr:hypothetical protein BV20DRAFT_636637 [Pilatotrama ljubarskyi]
MHLALRYSPLRHSYCHCSIISRTSVTGSDGGAGAVRDGAYWFTQCSLYLLILLLFVETRLRVIQGEGLFTLYGVLFFLFRLVSLLFLRLTTQLTCRRYTRFPAPQESESI